MLFRSGKLPTSLNSLHKTIEISLLKEISNGITIFSDSPTVAAANLSQLFDTDVEYMKSSPESTIIDCFNSRTFIGTSSKLSIWIAIFRILIKTENNETLLPKNLELNLRRNLPHDFGKIIFY